MACSIKYYYLIISLINILAMYKNVMELFFNNSIILNFDIKRFATHIYYTHLSFRSIGSNDIFLLSVEKWLIKESKFRVDEYVIDKSPHH